MSRAHQLKISVAGVRGVVGEFLTPNLACAFAQAFGTYVGPGPVVVARDTRASGEMLVHAVSCGLLASGCEVIRIGIAPTPTAQIYVADIRAAGGIAVTASHNPAEYNALKLFNGEGLFFNQYERAELLDVYHQSEFRHALNEEMRRVVIDAETAPERHFARILRHVDVERIRRRRFRVALDGVNGAGSVMSVRFLRDVLGCELHAIHVDPEKPFPRDPEPRAEVLTELSELVVRVRADAGFAQDPDGDRLAVAGETGRVLDNDDVLALAVDCALRKKKGPVVVNLTTSSAIDDIAVRHGCPVHRAPVGEANVVERMRRVQAVIGGEGGNGGIIFPAVHYCRDSYLGMALLLERLAETGETLNALAAGLPRYWRRSGKLPFEHGRVGQMMQALEAALPGARADRTDGLKLMVDEGWVHVRASNTEPLVRVSAEAKTREEADRLYELAVSLR